MKKLAIVLSLMFISIGVFGQWDPLIYINGTRLSEAPTTIENSDFKLEYINDIIYKNIPFIDNDGFDDHVLIVFKSPVDITSVTDYYWDDYVAYDFVYLDNNFEFKREYIESRSGSGSVEMYNVISMRIHKKFSPDVNIFYTKKEMPKYTQQDTIDAYNNGQQNVRDSIANVPSKTETFKSNSVDYDITVSNGYLTVESFDFVNKITIYDVNGRVVKVENMFNVWVEDLTKGVYIAVVEFDDKSVSYKFSR
jgi:hypothetical protein